MRKFLVDGLGNDFVLSSCFFRKFYFSCYWNRMYVRVLLAGIKDQTSKVEYLASTYNAGPEIRKVGDCARLISFLESFCAGEKPALTPQPKGTPFQIKVWNQLRGITFGETKSYRDIAVEIGQPDACRAVGNACGKNPILLLIPCHRVITSKNTMGGFSGGFSLKRTLLDIEGVNLV